MAKSSSLKARLKFRGGINQQDRMIRDKDRSLRKALLYSYQAATAILSDQKAFRCLINPNKLTEDVDEKVLSIPFYSIPAYVRPTVPSEPVSDIDAGTNGDSSWEDMENIPMIIGELSNEESWEETESGIWEDFGQLDEDGDIIYNDKVEDINIKEGDVITWKENNTHWLVYMRALEEVAYFRSNLRRCRHFIELFNGSKYWVYVKGPDEKGIAWTQKSGNFYNKLNYTLQMYITQNEETLKIFHRFKKIMINGKPWEVQAADSLTTPGIITVNLKETFSNTPETDIEKAVQESINEVKVEEQEGIYIHGPLEVYPYDVCNYELKNCGDAGIWKIVSETRKGMVKLIDLGDYKIELNIMTGKSGNFDIVYEALDGNIIASARIKVLSV